MKPTMEQQIQQLEAEKRSLLSEDDVPWDEVNAVERELRFLKGLSGLQSDLESSLTTPEKPTDSLSDASYAPEGSAVAMMESAAKKRPR